MSSSKFPDSPLAAKPRKTPWHRRLSSQPPRLSGAGKRKTSSGWSVIRALITIFVGALVFVLAAKVLRWGVLDATFFGSTRGDCTGEGACWPFVTTRIGQFLYGFYPAEERWRVNLMALGATFYGAYLFTPASLLRKTLASGLLLICGFVLLKGGFFSLTPVETTQWGGLFLTLVLALTGTLASLPLGILLALGRRSSMPVVRSLSTAFIEVVRGVPLITVLFLASVMLPIILPPGTHFDKLLRALIGITMFAAAYMAEVVRGGLEAVPKGQYEAASALGLSKAQTLALVVLPQALRKVVPAIVNTWIGLFKDTTLVLIIGMFDLLGMVQAGSTDPGWLGTSMEGYVFAGAVYWIFCFGLSRLSHRLEESSTAAQSHLV